jgi:hypothetical protein
MRLAVLIAFVATAMGRRQWGKAMLSELEQIVGRRERLRFTLGCVGALVTTVPLLTAVALVGGLASLTIVAVALVRYPGLVTGVGTWLAVAFFVAVVGAYVVGLVALGHRLVESGLVAAAALAAGLIAGSWWVVGFAASQHFPAAVPMSLLVLGPVVALGNGAWATLRTRSLPSGLTCVGLASLLAGFALFLAWGGQTVAFAGRPYDAGMLRDFHASGGHDLATYAVSDSLGSGMMLLLLVPLVSLTAGLAGAAVVSRRVRAAE